MHSYIYGYYIYIYTWITYTSYLIMMALISDYSLLEFEYHIPNFENLGCEAAKVNFFFLVYQKLSVSMLDWLWTMAIIST